MINFLSYMELFFFSSLFLFAGNADGDRARLFPNTKILFWFLFAIQSD